MEDNEILLEAAASTPFIAEDENDLINSDEMGMRMDEDEILPRLKGAQSVQESYHHDFIRLKERLNNICSLIIARF